MYNRTELQPLNFTFNSDDLLEHWHITKFLSELRAHDLWELAYISGSLKIRLNGIFLGLGFNKQLFDYTNRESSQRTLRELSRGVNRYLKIHRETTSIPMEVYLDIIKNEDRESIVCKILGHFDGLVSFLKTTGAEYLSNIELNDNSNEYVSPILLSYWVSEWFENCGMVMSVNFWEAITYNGTVLGLLNNISKIIKGRVCRIGDCRGITLHFPSKEYTLIRDITSGFDPELQFTDYTIQYFGRLEDITIQELQEYVSKRRLELIHIIPNYLIYHAHEFKTEDDLIRYLEWSVYRSQLEVQDYASSIPKNDGLRFTRGCIINSGLSKYAIFLNYLLWNSYLFNFPTSTNDYLEWRNIIQSFYKKFILTHESLLFLSEECYPVPRKLREYVHYQYESISEQPKTINRVALQSILRNYIEITFDGELDLIHSVTHEHGIQAQSGGLIRFSEIPSGPEFKINNIHVIRFITGKLRDTQFKSARIVNRINLLGDMTIPKVAGTEPTTYPNRILPSIQAIRKMNSLRLLCKKVLPFEVNNYFRKLADNLLFDSEIILSYWFGLLLEVIDSELEISNIIEGGSKESTYGLEVSVHRNKLKQSGIRVTVNIPKIMSVLDTAFHYLSGYNGNIEIIDFATLRRIFSHTLILSGKNNNDAIGQVLAKYLSASVTQVGVSGTGPTLRSEISHFEFVTSYSSIMSDIDMPSPSSIEDFDSFITDVILVYMHNIEPEFAIWKIKWCTPVVAQYILNLISDNFRDHTSYLIGFITPQFGDLVNYERYLLFSKMRKEATTERYLLLPKGRDIIEQAEFKLTIIERQAETFDDLIRYQKKTFPRLYYFINMKLDETEKILTLLSQRCRSVIIARDIGTQYARVFSTFSPTRARLCGRVSEFTQLSQRFLERFNIDNAGNPRFEYQRENSQLSLGNFWRELSRVMILENLEGPLSLSSCEYFMTYSDHYHYLGIGDERVRNILCVPCLSPYTIYDPKQYEQFEIFNVTYVRDEFPFLEIKKMEDIIKREFSRFDKRLVIFITFVVFNQYTLISDQLQVFKNICRLLARNTSRIHKIFINFYLMCGEFGDLSHFVLEKPVILFDDIHLQRVPTDREDILEGTFSSNYNFVQLLSKHDLKDIARREGISYSTLRMRDDMIQFALWNLGYSLSPFDRSGLIAASCFIPMIVLSS
nr:MAG: VP4 [Reoviridae sp.]